MSWSAVIRHRLHALLYPAKTIGRGNYAPSGEHRSLLALVEFVWIYLYPAVLPDHVKCNREREICRRPRCLHRRICGRRLALLVLLAATIAVARLQLLGQFKASWGPWHASIKAGLVLAFFMHLSNEGGFLKGMLALTIAGPDDPHRDDVL